MALMNGPRVVRQMPLSSPPCTEIDCDEFLAAKGAVWKEHGSAPSAIEVDGQFAGWGGLEPEQGEADFGWARSTLLGHRVCHAGGDRAPRLR
jgi:ribosomal-protein-alanine N-acetyltransferase